MERKLHAAMNRIFAQNAKKTVIIVSGKVFLVSGRNSNFPKLSSNVAMRVMFDRPAVNGKSGEPE